MYCSRKKKNGSVDVYQIQYYILDENNKYYLYKNYKHYYY